MLLQQYLWSYSKGSITINVICRIFFFESHQSAQQWWWGQMKSFNHFLSFTSIMALFIFKPFYSISFFTLSIQCLLRRLLFLISCIQVCIATSGILSRSILDTSKTTVVFLESSITELFLAWAIFLSLHFSYSAVLTHTVFLSASSLCSSAFLILQNSDKYSSISMTAASYMRSYFYLNVFCLPNLAAFRKFGSG